MNIRNSNSQQNDIIIKKKKVSGFLLFFFLKKFLNILFNKTSIMKYKQMNEYQYKMLKVFSFHQFEKKRNNLSQKAMLLMKNNQKDRKFTLKNPLS